MPTLVAGGISQLNASTRVILNGGQQACPRIAPTCNRVLILPRVEPAPATTLAIVNNANTQVNHEGSGVYTIEKSGGSNGVFDASAVSTAGFSGDFVLRLELVANTGFFVAGVNSDPLTDNDYTSVDYSFNDVGNIYENGNPFPLGSGWSVGGVNWIRRIGTTLDYLTGSDLATATVLRTVTGVSSTLYFDSSFYTAGTKIRAIYYQPVVDAITGTTTLSLASAATISGVGALTGASTLTFSAAATITGKGALTGSSSILFSPSATITGKGALTGSSSIAFSPSGTVAGRGSITGSSTLVLSPAGTITGRGALVGGSSLAFAPAGTLNGSGALLGTASLSFVASGVVFGLGGVAGSTDIAFAPSGTLTGVAVIVPLAPRRFVIRAGDQGYSGASRRAYTSSRSRSSRSSGGRSSSSVRGR